MSSDSVVKPEHYTWLPGVECLQVSRWFSSNCGQAIEMIWRHLHKGKPVEDLRKAVYFLNDEIDRLESLDN